MTAVVVFCDGITKRKNEREINKKEKKEIECGVGVYW